MKIQCDHCLQAYGYKPEYEGRSLICKNCTHKFRAIPIAQSQLKSKHSKPAINSPSPAPKTSAIHQSKTTPAIDTNSQVKKSEKKNLPNERLQRDSRSIPKSTLKRRPRKKRGQKKITFLSIVSAIFLSLLISGFFGTIQYQKKNNTWIAINKDQDRAMVERKKLDFEK